MHGRTCAGTWVTGTGLDGAPREVYLYHVSDNAETMARHMRRPSCGRPRSIRWSRWSCSRRACGRARACSARKRSIAVPFLDRLRARGEQWHIEERVTARPLTKSNGSRGTTQSSFPSGSAMTRNLNDFRGQLPPKSLKLGRTLSDGRTMAQCPRCDAPIIQGDQYCGICGTTLQPTAPPGSAPPGSRFAGHTVTPHPPVGSPPAASAQPWGQPRLCLSSDQFTPSQPPRAKRSSGEWVAAFVGLIAVAALAVGAVVFLTRDSNDYPKEWDAQVAPIAARVAQLRGLSFDHPVEARVPVARRLREGSDGEPRRAEGPEGRDRAGDRRVPVGGTHRRRCRPRPRRSTTRRRPT